MEIYHPYPIPKLEFGKIDERIYVVVAGNYRQFNLFCDHRLSVFERSGDWQGEEYIYYSSFESIAGLRIDGVIQCGTWYERDDVDWNYLRAIQRRNA